MEARKINLIAQRICIIVLFLLLIFELYCGRVLVSILLILTIFWVYVTHRIIWNGERL